MNHGQLHQVSTFCSNATFTFGATCAVIRRLFCCTVPRFSAGLVVSATYVHAFGLYAFWFSKIPANAFA